MIFLVGIAVVRLAGRHILIPHQLRAGVRHAPDQVKIDDVAFDLVPVFAVVQQRHAVIALRQVNPLVPGHLIPRQVPTGVAMGRPADMAELDLVGRLVGLHRDRECDAQHGLPLAPACPRCKHQQRTAGRQGDLLHDDGVAQPVRLRQHSARAIQMGLRRDQFHVTRRALGVIHREIPGIARVAVHRQPVGPLAGRDDLAFRELVVDRDDGPILVEAHPQPVVFKPVGRRVDIRDRFAGPGRIHGRIAQSRNRNPTPARGQTEPFAPLPGKRVEHHDRLLHPCRGDAVGQSPLAFSDQRLHLGQQRLVAGRGFVVHPFDRRARQDIVELVEQHFLPDGIQPLAG